MHRSPQIYFPRISTTQQLVHSRTYLNMLMALLYIKPNPEMKTFIDSRALCLSFTILQFQPIKILNYLNI